MTQDTRKTTRCAMPLLLAVWWAAAMAPGPAAAQMGSGELVGTYIERNAELLQWAADLVADTDNGPAREVLRKAREMHVRSETMLRGGQPAEAAAVARRVRDAVWHAVRLARESVGLEERVRLRAERFGDQHQMLGERARDAGDERALDFLDRAESHARRARDRYAQGDYQAALRLMEQAEDLLRRAAQFLADGAGSQRVASEIERTGALLDQVRANLGRDGDPRRRQLLSEAEEALQRAEDARRDGHTGQALQMAALARRLLDRARADTADRSETIDGAAVERLFKRFDDRAQVVAPRVAEAGSEAARRHLDNAMRQRDRAQESWDGGGREIALRHLRAALDLLDRAGELAR